MLSRDGRQWEITAEWAQPGKDDGNNLMSAVYAENRFVVAGGGGGGPSAAGHILVSADGHDWTAVHTGQARVNPILHGGERFVAGVSGYPSGTLLWSDDGASWSAGAAIKTKGLTHFRHGAYGNGVFVLVGNAGGNGGRSWAIVTPDGQAITHEVDELPGHGTLVFGGGRFVMMTTHSNSGLVASTDGAAWQPVALDADARVDWLVWTGREFLAGDGKSGWRSPDGVVWTTEPLPARGRVVWSDGVRSITTSWPGKMAYSADGKTWELSPPLTENGINCVVHRGAD